MRSSNSCGSSDGPGAEPKGMIERRVNFLCLDGDVRVRVSCLSLALDGLAGSIQLPSLKVRRCECYFHCS